jgi:hypothetical protein
MSNLFADLEKTRAEQRKIVARQDAVTKPKPTRKSTRPRAQSRDNARDTSRTTSRGKSREKPRELPKRDEVQEFTFRLRDQLKVKLQAEVPHPWQKEFEAIARKLDVKKLELYRFILGEFLGKVRRKKAA